MSKFFLQALPPIQATKALLQPFLIGETRCLIAEGKAIIEPLGLTKSWMSLSPVRFCASLKFGASSSPLSF